MKTKRILMVTSVLPRYEGDATPAFVLNQARALVHLGYAVRILAPHGVGAKWSERVEGVEVVRFPYFWPLRYQKLCYEGGMLINFRHRPWTKLLLPFFAVAELIALGWQVARFRPDIIHSHSLLPQSLLAGVVADCCGLPHVATSHGNDVFGLKKAGLMGWLKRRAISGAELVTANSSATRDALIELGCQVERIRIVPATPVELSGDPVEAAGREPERLCFVGRLIAEKGVADLLQAFAIVARVRSNARLVIVGDGQDRHRFEALANSLGIAANCVWTGWLTQSDARREMARARAVVVPSRETPGGWREAQGLVVVEGMLAGATIVASRAGGIPDMIADSVNGRLTAPGDGEELARVLLEVLENQQEADRLAAAGMETARQRFSASAVTRQLVAVYSELLT